MIDHTKIEKNSILMIVLTLIVVSIGGLVEIVPLYYLGNTVQKVPGVRPYTALELEGRDIYIKEGCYNCHSQMIRPFRDEDLRYGHYSVAAESMYDHPFQWGSKRTGPDLARVGGKYSDQWHVEHLKDPRSVVPESIMPRYPWLAENMVDATMTPKKMTALRKVGVPYTDEQIQKASAEVKGKTEMDALVAYLQVLGTMVDFSKTNNTAEEKGRTTAMAPSGSSKRGAHI